MGHRIAYLMSRFPQLSETFILREMSELECQGWELFLYPLVIQQPRVMHAEARTWIPRVHRLPYLSRDMFTAHRRLLVRRPAEYRRLLAQTLWENRTSPKFLSRAVALFPKAVQAATRMQQEGIEHIHAHYATHPALAAWLIHRLTGISFSITVHAHDIFVRREMLATKLRDAAFIVAISEFNRDFVARAIGDWVREKTVVIHCGIRPADYAQPAVARGGEKYLEIINIGSLQPYKGQRHLIGACALLRDQGIPFHCRIIGGGQLRSELERQIVQAGLDGKVKLLGPRPQEEVGRILQTADCYVQPSVITPSGKMEGIPVALMEAFASGLPVVATSISGIPELVRPHETGYLVPPADAAALAGQLRNVYTNPAQARALAQAGRALVLREFDLAGNVQKLAAHFMSVVSFSSEAGKLME